MNMLCPVHGTPSKLIPAGVSKTSGKAYSEFWACSERGCRAKQVEEGTMMAKPDGVFKAEARARHYTAEIENESKDEYWAKKGQQMNRSNLAAAVLHGKPLDWKLLVSLEAWVISGKTPNEVIGEVDIDNIPF